MTIQTSIFSDNHFYRTVPMSSGEEIEAEKGALSEEKKILEYLKKTGKEMTAWQILEIFPESLIGNIRRALFNLEMKSCVIIQTGWVMGPKRRNVGKYKAL